MTGKADFTEEEWTRLKRAPFIAGMAISLADHGGPIELIKETAAALRVVTETSESSWAPWLTIVRVSAGAAPAG